MGVIQQDPTPDLNPDMLAMLESLMLAQAQEVFVIKAIKGKFVNILIVKRWLNVNIFKYSFKIIILIYYVFIILLDISNVL